MLLALAAQAHAPRASARAGAAARSAGAARASAHLSAPHRSGVSAPGALLRAHAAALVSPRRAAAICARTGRVIGAAAQRKRIAAGVARAADADGADAAGGGVAGDVADDEDAPAAWLADEDDAEECAAVFEVSQQALRSLCHGNAPPPPCTHEYWRARGWRARPRDWERWAGTRWESREAWPQRCVADDAGDDAQAAAGSERERAAYAHAQDAQPQQHSS